MADNSGKLSAPSEALRSAVFRVVDAGDPGTTLGTAFGIAERVAVSCAHVVIGRDAANLRFEIADGLVPITRAVSHPNAEHVDLAALHTAEPLPTTLLAATDESIVQLGHMLSRGFPASGFSREQFEIRLEPRGRITAAYDAYLIEDAFDMTGDLAERGFSGAPLVDARSGAVVGVVSSGYGQRGRSWAVPLAAARDWDALKPSLAWNKANLPRFGAIVNGAGAELLCRWQGQHAIQRLGRAGKFVTAWHVARTEIQASVRNFIAGTYPALAIVGDTNVGKTWLLCDLARQACNSPSLLLEARELDRNAGATLETLAHAAFTRAAHSETGGFLDQDRIPDSAQLAAACQGSGRPLLILLDGVNEAMGTTGFLKNWLPEAAGWCRENGARLIFTVRPEVWPMIADSLPEPTQLLYAEVSANQDTEPGRQRPPRAEDRCLRLGGFTADEADLASDRYGIAPETETALRGHPFLFRVAHDLGQGVVEAGAGRYRLLDAFIDRHLDQAAAHLGVARGTTRAQLRRLAGALPAAGMGSLAREEAELLLGGFDVLDAVASVSLLRITETDRVSFTYDQVAEALLPVPQDLDALFPMPSTEGAIAASAIQGGVAALLRLEADNREKEFRSGVDLLLVRLESSRVKLEEGGDWSLFHRGFEPLCEAAIRVAGALPNTREQVVDEIYQFLANCSQLFVTFDSIGRVARWLADAPLSAARRAALLLDIAPWGDAWPWRWKDWSDPSRRSTFSERLEDIEVRGYDSNLVAPLLHRVLFDTPADVRPIILDGLGNSTRIEKGRSNDSRGEATISSLCAGLLFHRRADDLPSLLDALFTRPNAARLVDEIAKDNPEAVATHALARLGDSKRVLSAIAAFRFAVPSLSEELRARVVETLEPLVKPSGSEVAHAVALILCDLDPANTAAWDELAQSLHPSRSEIAYHLHPIPSVRVKQAVELAKRFGEDIAYVILRELDGPEVDQDWLTAVVDELYRQGRMRAFLFGAIIESKLHLIKNDNDIRYKPWAELAQRIAEHGPDDARTCLIHASFSCHDPNPSVEAVRNVLLTSELSSSDVDLIVEKLLAWHVSTTIWLPLFDQTRRSAPKQADFRMSFQIRSDFRFQRRHERAAETALALIDYWRSLPDNAQSDLSLQAIELLDAGSSLEEIFSIERLIS